ncbi:alpha/beta hydrolase [Streptomyces sp. ACA25]|uniref:alpha/beta hydrolase n=1 Tax=Streptomyces sp. ACA25 TaxID=3022596 RepID=UPI002307344B|nr:alpha/beta hydrolase [Streptomyces sp. ACA25]MDB1087752.1 alpha/beta hydrolase [Streptomyces sp. ACA25]
MRNHRSARSASLLTAARRMLLPLAVVLAVLATSGWITRTESPAPGTWTAELQGWQRHALAGVPLADADAPPQEIAQFFGTLGHRKQLLLAERFPLVVGNLDGAPAEVRYAANRHALLRARAQERERMRDERLSPAGQHEAGRRMHRFDSLLRDDRQILAFDPHGRGRAAEVFGDLDLARRISVVVPGVDTDLLTFERTRLKYRAPSGMAEALHEEQQATRTAGNTAVIAWADYTSPRGVGVAAATGDLAKEGAERLADTVRGLPGESTVALFCHSYGSVVCGLSAERLPGRVTDIAVSGSPGMRVSHAGELGTDARVWAARAGNDWVGDLPHLAVGPLGHGIDPVHPSFGARRLGAGPTGGHAGYFVPGSDSLRNFARIGVGDLDALRWDADMAYCAPEGPMGRSVWNTRHIPAERRTHVSVGAYDDSHG